MSVSVCCAYLHCENSRFKNKDLSFFTFPFKNANKCKIWVRNCGNHDLLELDFDKLSKKVLCEEHFKPTDYFNANVRIKRLLPNVVPLSIYKGDDSSTISMPESLPSVTGLHHLRTYSKIVPVVHYPLSDDSKKIEHSRLEANAAKSSEEYDSGIVVIPPAEDTRRNTKLKGMIITKNRNIIKLRQQIRRLQKKLSASIPIPTDISMAAKTFIYMQQHHRSGQKWTPIEKRLALALYYKSPSNYKFMQQALQFQLPGLSTIRMWLRVTNLGTGVNNALVRKLAIKVKTMTTLERQCIVMFDAMSLSVNSNLNEFERIEANTATLFYLQSLQCTWKSPFCYYIHETLIAEALKNCLMDVLDKLFSIGLKPKVIICDQSPIKRKLLTLLDVVPERTFFIFNNNDIHVCFDTNHLINGLRNNFSNEKFIFKVGEQRVRWSDVVRTYDIDCHSRTGPDVLKLPKAPIHPDNTKANQVFSNRIADAIETASANGQLNSESAYATSAFIKTINDIFDCLNSNPSQIHKNPEMLLKNAIPWVKSITVHDAETKKKLRNIYCLKGLLLTIASVLNVWTDLSDNESTNLLTGRINQNPLERVFERIRHVGGVYNTHPTRKQFRLAIQRDVFRRLKQGPVEPEEDSDEETANSDFDDNFLIADETLLSASEDEDDEETKDFVEEYRISSPIDAKCTS